MSSQPMTLAEREQRRMAREHGSRAKQAIAMAAAVTSSSGDKWVSWAYNHARNAFHEAGRALRAADRRRR